MCSRVPVRRASGFDTRHGTTGHQAGRIGKIMHKPTGVMCAACNLAGITREIVGYLNDTVPYVTVRWDVMGDPRKRVPVCQTCADWRETV